MATIATNKLLALVNRDNPKALLSLANVTLTTGAANTNAEVIRDTMVTLSGVAGSNRKNSVTVYYNRVDLGILFKNITVSLPFEALAGSSYKNTDLVDKLNLKYGTDFEATDFVEAPMDVSSLPTNVTLTVATGNHAYQGSVTILVSEGSSELSSVVVNTTLDGFNYPSGDTTKGQAAIYSYNFDGSNDVGNYDWSAVTGSTLTTAAFIEAFNRIDGVDDTWLVDGVAAQNFNLYGATIKYNGANASADITTALGKEVLLNNLYQSVLIFELGELCSNFAGLITVYYGGLKA